MLPKGHSIMQAIAVKRARAAVRQMHPLRAMALEAAFALAAAVAPTLALSQPGRVPGTGEIKTCIADTAADRGDEWASLAVSCMGLLRALPAAAIVTETQWWHEYSHVSGGQRYGYLVLHDGVRLRWMVKPGGLAWLSWPDGSKVYLVICCTKAEGLYQ